MPTLPNAFRPVVSAYGFDEPGGVVRTEVAGGAARYALNFDRGTQRYKVTLMFDPLEASVWSAFYHHVIKKGALSFDMLLDSGFGTDLHTCNILPGSYSASRNSALTVVSFVVEAESQVYDLDAAEGAGLVDVYNEYGDQSNALLAALAQFATVDSNVLDF